MNSLNSSGFDAQKFYLGAMCNHAHEYQNTSKSLRYTRPPNNCAVCARLAAGRINKQRAEQKQIEKFNSLPVCPYPKPNFDSSKFYLGTLCERSHAFCDGLSLRRARSGECLACKDLTRRERIAADVDKYRREGREVYYRRKEKALQGCKIRYNKKRDEILAKGRAKYHRNIEAERAKNRLYRTTPAGKLAGIRAIHRRRARKGQNHAVQWAKTDLDRRFQQFENLCAYCGGSSKVTMDHFIAISKGGSECIGNIIPACADCNFSKSAKDPWFWYKSQPFFTRSKWQKILKVLGKTQATYSQIPLL